MLAFAEMQEELGSKRDSTDNAIKSGVNAQIGEMPMLAGDCPGRGRPR